MKQKKTVIVGSIIFIVFFLFTIVQVSAFTLSTNTKLLSNEVYGIHVVQNDDEHRIFIKTNASTLRVSITNVSNFESFQNGNPLITKIDLDYIINTSLILDYELVLKNLGDSSKLYGEYSEEIEYYLCIINESEEIIQFSIDMKPNKSQFTQVFRYASRMNLVMCCLYVSVTMLLYSVKVKKQFPDSTDHRISQGFGIAFLITFINYLLTEIDQWIGRDFHIDLLPDVKYGGALIPFMSLRLDQLSFILLIAVSQIVMIYVVEVDVLSRKYPIFAITLMITNLLVVISLLIPGFFDIIIIVSVLFQLIIFFYICFLYFHLGHMNEGVIKFKSYSVAIGLLTPLMMLILGEYLFPWDSELSLGIADMFSIIALLFLKYGIAEESTLFKI